MLTFGRSLGHLDKVLLDVGHLDVEGGARDGRDRGEAGLETTRGDGNRLQDDRDRQMVSGGPVDLASTKP